MLNALHPAKNPLAKPNAPEEVLHGTPSGAISSETLDKTLSVVADAVSGKLFRSEAAKVSVSADTQSRPAPVSALQVSSPCTSQELQSTSRVAEVLFETHNVSSQEEMLTDVHTASTPASQPQRRYPVRGRLTSEKGGQT